MAARKRTTTKTTRTRSTAPQRSMVRPVERDDDLHAGVDKKVLDTWVPDASQQAIDAEASTDDDDQAPAATAGEPPVDDERLLDEGQR